MSDVTLTLTAEDLATVRQALTTARRAVRKVNSEQERGFSLTMEAADIIHNNGTDDDLTRLLFAVERAGLSI
jgi:hypothetical protein